MIKITGRQDEQTVQLEYILTRKNVPFEREVTDGRAELVLNYMDAVEYINKLGRE